MSTSPFFSEIRFDTSSEGFHQELRERNIAAHFEALLQGRERHASNPDELFELFAFGLQDFCRQHPELSFDEQDASESGRLFIAELFNDFSPEAPPSGLRAARPFAQLFAEKFRQSRTALFGSYGLSFDAAGEGSLSTFESLCERLAFEMDGKDDGPFSLRAAFSGEGIPSFDTVTRPFVFALRKFDAATDTSAFVPANRTLATTLFVFLEFAGASLSAGFSSPHRDAFIERNFRDFLRHRSPELFGAYAGRLLRTLHPDVCKASRAAG